MYMKKYLKYGMVGGALSAFIGGVHRVAIQFDGRADLVAGCFTQREDANKECGDFYRLDEDRIYSDFCEMAAKSTSKYKNYSNK